MARLAQRRRGNVQGLSVPGDDFGEFRQGLDLVADDPPHRCRALARLFRQVEHALLQLAAGHVEVALQFLRGGAHLGGRLGEAAARLGDRAPDIVDERPVGLAHGFRSAPALGAGRAVQRLEILDDAFGRRRSIFGEHPADRSGAFFRRLQRLGDDTGERPHHAVELLGPRPQAGCQALESGPALLDRRFDLPVDLREVPGGFGQRPGLLLEALDDLGDAVEDLARNFAELGNLGAELAGRKLGRLDRMLDRGGELGGAPAEIVSILTRLSSVVFSSASIICIEPPRRSTISPTSRPSFSLVDEKVAATRSPLSMRVRAA